MGKYVKKRNIKFLPGWLNPMQTGEKTKFARKRCCHMHKAS
jgi:hypothetical protein